jgi:DnaJ-class molecular chaperone
VTERHIPRPLKEGKLCTECNGTGADIKATLKMPEWEVGHVMCRACNGNGLDPAEYFRFGGNDANSLRQ